MFELEEISTGFHDSFLNKFVVSVFWNVFRVEVQFNIPWTRHSYWCGWWREGGPLFPAIKKRTKGEEKHVLSLSFYRFFPVFFRCYDSWCSHIDTVCRDLQFCLFWNCKCFRKCEHCFTNSRKEGGRFVVYLTGSPWPLRSLSVWLFPANFSLVVRSVGVVVVSPVCGGKSRGEWK